MSSSSKPPYAQELHDALANFPTPIITQETLPVIRLATASLFTAELTLSGRTILHEERTIPGPHGDIVLSILRPATANENPQPGIYYIHGGGLIMGNRFLGLSIMADMVEDLDVVCVSVEYRLAPEFPHPIPLEDCYAGIKWLESNLTELKIDPSRLILAGLSAGGGLAAALALYTGDRGGPKLCAQLLMCPMLDDRNHSISCSQYAEEGTWSRENNIAGWKNFLGEGAGKEDVEIYAAPGRARVEELSGLPPVYIDVGSAEVFRDEDVSYASRLWEAGVQVELHVWPGGFHGFEGIAPGAVMSQISKKTRTDWVRRILSGII